MNQFALHCLSFLATSDSFWTLHTQFRREAATIASIVYEVCDSIYQVLQPIYMTPPHRGRLETDRIQIQY